MGNTGLLLHDVTQQLRPQRHSLHPHEAGPVADLSGLVGRAMFLRTTTNPQQRSLRNVLATLHNQILCTLRGNKTIQNSPFEVGSIIGTAVRPSR